MPLSGGTSTGSSSGGGGGAPPVGYTAAFPNNYANPYQPGDGTKWLKTGTSVLAAPYPLAPSVVYGQSPVNHTTWKLGYSYNDNNSPGLMKNDGSSNVLIVGNTGQYAEYSANGGQTWSNAGSTGLSSTTVNDMCWHAAASLFVIATASGLYTCSVGSTTLTLRQSGNFVSVASNGTTLIATQNTAANANTTTFYTSTNATSWAAQTGVSGLSTSSFIYSCIRYFNGLWIAVGNTTLATSNNVYTSTNGTTWTSVGTTASGISDIGYGGGYYVFINGYSNSSNAYAYIYASLSGTISAYAVVSLYVYGATTVNLGQLAWNGYYFVVPTFQYNTGQPNGYAFYQNGSNITTFYLSGTSVISSQSAGACCAFSSGTYAGIFLTVGYGGYAMIYNTYFGTYVDVGRNVTSYTSNLTYYGRIS